MRYVCFPLPCLIDATSTTAKSRNPKTSSLPKAKDGTKRGTETVTRYHVLGSSFGSNLIGARGCEKFARWDMANNTATMSSASVSASRQRVVLARSPRTRAITRLLASNHMSLKLMELQRVQQRKLLSRLCLSAWKSKCRFYPCCRRLLTRADIEWPVSATPICHLRAML